MENTQHKILQWMQSKGYEILAQKKISDGRISFVAKKNYTPGFVKESKDELKVLRLAGVIETADSFQKSDAVEQMKRLVLWKGMSCSNEKWLVLFTPEGVTRADTDHLYNYNQKVTYPISEHEVLDNEPRVSQLGIKGWSP